MAEAVHQGSWRPQHHRPVRVDAEQVRREVQANVSWRHPDEIELLEELRVNCLNIERLEGRDLSHEERLDLADRERKVLGILRHLQVYPVPA